MGILAFLLVAAIAAYLIFYVLLIVAAFRVNVGWGIATFFFAPIALVFAIVHWQNGGKRFLGMIGGFVAVTGIVTAMFVTDPGMKSAFLRGFAAGMARRGVPIAAKPASQDPRASHDARDLAANEPSSTPASAQPTATPIDPFAVQRAACVKHAADLNATYIDLNKARAKLKKGSPEVAAFNVKAAKYQEGLRALAAEQAQLAALDYPAVVPAVAPPAKAAPTLAAGGAKEAEANAALTRLRTQAAQGDYPAFASTLKKCLADYRQTAAYPQIAAAARGTLANATPDKLAAAIQAQGAAARKELDTAMGRVRAIVNQTPPAVPKPPTSAEIYHYGYHPGAPTPDYAHADLFSTRELWNGEYAYLDTAPGVYYRSADCEFNPQTKFFVTNRDVPTKKLTDAEIAEVVRLYRTIASDQQVVAALPQRLHDAQAASPALLALNQQLAAGR